MRFISSFRFEEASSVEDNDFFIEVGEEESDEVTESSGFSFTVVCTSLIVFPARYEIKAGKIGSMQGEKNDPKPANADTSIL